MSYPNSVTVDPVELSSNDITKIRLLIVQYAGDYRETFYRFAAGQGETYRAQRYSVETLADMSQQLQEVATLCCQSEQAYDEVLPNGVRAIGAGMQGTVDFKAIVQRIAQHNPTHLVIRTPAPELFQWAIDHRVMTIATLADSFQPRRLLSPGGLRDRLKFSQLVKVLNHPQIRWIGNHGVSASQSLAAIGVNLDKIIPYDSPPSTTPDAFPERTLNPDKAEWNLLYVGAISESKGVGNAIEAVAELRQKNIPARLKLAGKGDIEQFQALAHKLKLDDAVEFLGLVENKLIVGLMQQADLVLVPSWREHPEGFPFTIYESLCARTPVVVSDHPMFLKTLEHKRNAIVFPSNNSAALAKAVQDILADPNLYHQISQSTLETWNSLQLPVMWADLINGWLRSSPTDRAWLAKHSLTSGSY